jgi:Tfp pilus assembly protein PilX
MKTLGRIFARKARTGGGKDRGVALLFSLLLLVIMSALGILMVLTVSPDMMINGYYGNFRGSFYAADSGLNIARQQLINQTQAAVNLTPCTGWVTNSVSPCDQPPLASTSGGTVLSGLTSLYGSSYVPLQGGQAANSWPENFQLANTAGCTNSYAMAPGYPVATHQNALGQNDVYSYGFNYKLCVMGRAQSAQQVVTSETGTIFFTITAQSTNTLSHQQSFAAYGYFVDNYTPCSAPLVPGTLTGPLFTNGQWQFSTSGSYIFTDPVGQQNANAGYWFGGTCIQSPNTSYTSGGQTIRPTFQQGFNPGQQHVNAPSNDFSQKWAVLDGMGCGEGSNVCSNPSSPAPPAVTNSDLNAHLKNINGTAYPTGGASSGVYMPYSCTGGPPCVNTVNGGGIYVKGNASVVPSIGTDAGGNPTQIFTITQGGTTTTITTNTAANTTTMVSGGTVTTLRGVPDNLTSGTASPATMLYVDGTISSLSGTGQGVPAIQDASAVTITANGDVNITGDVLYKTKPVTSNASDTLIAGNDNNQVLGIFTNTGTIVFSSPYSNKNLEVDASIAALGSGCASSGSGCTFSTSGSINTLNIMGGRITSNISGISVTTRNLFFDRRFTTRTGFAPPWFPSTTVTVSGGLSPLTPLVSQSTQRTSWVTTPQ